MTQVRFDFLIRTELCGHARVEYLIGATIQLARNMQLKVFLFVVQCLWKISVADIRSSTGDNVSGENSFPGTAQLISVPRRNRANRDFERATNLAAIREYNDLLNVDTRNFSENQKVLFNRIVERVARLGTVNGHRVSNGSASVTTEPGQSNSSDLNDNVNNDVIEIEAGRSNKKYSHRLSPTSSSSVSTSSSSSLSLNSNRPLPSQMIPVPIKIKTKQNLHDNGNSNNGNHFHNGNSNNSGNNNSGKNGKLKDIPSTSTRYQNKTNGAGTHNNSKKKNKIFVNNTVSDNSVGGVNNRPTNGNIDQKVLFGNISTVSIVDSLSQTVKNGVTNKDLYVRERPSTTSATSLANNTKKFIKVNMCVLYVAIR